MHTVYVYLTNIFWLIRCFLQSKKFHAATVISTSFFSEHLIVIKSIWEQQFLPHFPYLPAGTDRPQMISCNWNTENKWFVFRNKTRNWLGVNAHDYMLGHTASFEHHNMSNPVHHMIMCFVWGYFQQSIVRTSCYRISGSGNEKKHIFIPWKVLWSIELAINGGINFAGEVVLYRVENLGSFERGFLPGRSSIVRCAEELHAGTIHSSNV
jgi:hypothetical protein